MFKYTAHPDVLRKYRNIVHRSPPIVGAAYRYACEITRSPQAYLDCGDFWRHYININLYSSTKLSRVPVNGVLIDAHWFLESDNNCIDASTVL
jgi:hypothetical protein